MEMVKIEKEKPGMKSPTSLVQLIREKLLKGEESWTKRANEVIRSAEES